MTDILNPRSQVEVSTLNSKAPGRIPIRGPWNAGKWEGFKLLREHREALELDFWAPQLVTSRLGLY